MSSYWQELLEEAQLLEFDTCGKRTSSETAVVSTSPYCCLTPVAFQGPGENRREASCFNDPAPVSRSLTWSPQALIPTSTAVYVKVLSFR